MRFTNCDSKCDSKLVTNCDSKTTQEVIRSSPGICFVANTQRGSSIPSEGAGCAGRGPFVNVGFSMPMAAVTLTHSNNLSRSNTMSRLSTVLLNPKLVGKFWSIVNRHEHPVFQRAIQHLLLMEVAWALHLWQDVAYERRQQRHVIARVRTPRLCAAFFTWLEVAAISKSKMADDAHINIKLQLGRRDLTDLASHPRERVGQLIALIAERTRCPMYAIRLVLRGKVISHHKQATLSSLGVVEGDALTMVVVQDRAAQRFTGEKAVDVQWAPGVRRKDMYREYTC